MSSLENVQSLQKKRLMLDLLTASQLSKSLGAFTNQLDPQSIVMFFKCMEASCDFCTDEEDKFKNHLLDHINPENQCCYCDTVALNEADIVKHMVAIHGSCKFQCAMCFYRSQTLTHIRVHSLVRHQSRTVLWYLCSERAAVDTSLVSCNRDHIGNYVCMSDCNFKSPCTEHFSQHLSVAHEGSCNFSCHICSEKLCSPDAVINHYTEIHGFYAFHCFYCSFGSHIDWDVVTHLTSCHSDKPFRFFCRGDEIPKSFVKLKELEKLSFHGGISPSFTCLPPGHSPKYEQEESAMYKKPGLHVKVEMEMPVENCLPVKDEDIKKNTLDPASESSEFRCKCGALSGNVAMFLQHIGEHHSQDSGFDCPLCVKFTNGCVKDLFVHIVDCHTVYFRCIYKSCFFLGTCQESIDSHIMQVHQHYDLLPENVSAADHEAVCSTAGAMATESDKHCYDDTVHGLNHGDTAGEESPFKEGNKLLCSAEVTHTCSLCNRTDMQPLDYFRHMSLGHGVKYFCGHCEKCYKQKKQMILHHDRCHSGLQLLVRTFENNKLKDITQKTELDQENKVQGKVEIKSVNMATSNPNANAGPFASNITSLSTALHYSRAKKKALLMPCASGSEQDVHCRQRNYLERFGNLEPIPLGKKHVILGKQKRRQDCPGYLGSTKQAYQPCETKQMDQASTPSTVSNVQHPHGNRPGVELSGGRKSSHHSRPVGFREKPLNGVSERCQQPTNESKPFYYCGHCLKGYKLLKALITHQKTVHRALPLAVKRLDMSKLDDVTNDIVAQNYKDEHTATTAKPDNFVSAQEDSASGISEASDASDSSCSEIGTPVTRGWRRIRLMDSESENESHVSSPHTPEEGFSYYGKPVEPLDYSNLFVRIQDGDVRIAYSQLTRVLNAHPIVRVRKETSHVAQMGTK